MSWLFQINKIESTLKKSMLVIKYCQLYLTRSTGVLMFCYASIHSPHLFSALLTHTSNQGWPLLLLRYQQTKQTKSARCTASEKSGSFLRSVGPYITRFYRCPLPSSQFTLNVRDDGWVWTLPRAFHSALDASRFVYASFLLCFSAFLCPKRINLVAGLA